MLNEIKKLLSELGYAHLPNYECGKNTEQIATEMGNVFSVSEILGGAYIPDVQTLKPKEKHAGMLNRYSGVFGLDAFPYHSDLAHWEIPPRYLLLRCIIGSAKVTTNLISWSELAEQLNRKDLERAVFRTRRKSPHVSPSLLSLKFEHQGVQGLRWDSLFLLPMNSYAKNVKEAFNDINLEAALEKKISLLNFGDTLLIDNWKMLHGRSAVPQSARERKIERIYLSSLRE